MKTRVANAGPRINPLSPNGIFGVPDLESMAEKQKQPVNTRVVCDGPRIIPLSPNGMFGVASLESIAAKQKS